jgi:hypothetical protein
MSGVPDFAARAERANRLGYRVQAVVVVLWWIGMKWVPGVYEVFAFPGVEREVLFWFGLPDLVVLGGGAVWAGSRWRGHRMAGAAVLGGYLYATLWCLSASVRTGGGWFGTMVMSWAVLLNVLLLGRQSLFQVSDQTRPGWTGMKTALQSAGIWIMGLWLFPWVILETFGGIPPLRTGRLVMGVLVFLSGSAVGIRSAVEMVRHGKGTPLPMDTASDLVMGGPYAFVRNPMALGGLVQGMGVAVGVGSGALAFYVLLGCGVWHFFVRPEEELFLYSRFGERFAKYTEEVQCWIPKR